MAIILLSGLTGVGTSAQAQEPTPESTTTNAKVYHTRLKLGPGEGIRDVTIEGAVRFSPNETKIEWLDDGAYLHIITQEKGKVRRFDARADGQGHPIVGYEVDNRERPYDKDAAQYLVDVLPAVFRELGHNESGRVQTTYDQLGTAGVFQLLSEIRSDYSVGLHVSAFLNLEGLSDDEVSDPVPRKTFLGSRASVMANSL